VPELLEHAHAVRPAVFHEPPIPFDDAVIVDAQPKRRARVHRADLEDREANATLRALRVVIDEGVADAAPIEPRVVCRAHHAVRNLDVADADRLEHSGQGHGTDSSRTC
jgi:hypothetical protein